MDSIVKNWYDKDGIIMDMEEWGGEYFIHLYIEHWNRKMFDRFIEVYDWALQKCKDMNIKHVCCIILDGDDKLERFADYWGFVPLHVNLGKFEIWRKKI